VLLCIAGAFASFECTSDSMSKINSSCSTVSVVSSNSSDHWNPAVHDGNSTIIVATDWNGEARITVLGDAHVGTLIMSGPELIAPIPTVITVKHRLFLHHCRFHNVTVIAKDVDECFIASSSFDGTPIGDALLVAPVDLAYGIRNVSAHPTGNNSVCIDLTTRRAHD